MIVLLTELLANYKKYVIKIQKITNIKINSNLEIYEI